MFKTKKDLTKVVKILDELGILNAHIGFFSDNIESLKRGYSIDSIHSSLKGLENKIDMLFDYLKLEIQYRENPIVAKKKKVTTKQ